MMKLNILLLSSLFSFSSFAFEINTHQAITSCALSTKCIKITEQQGAANLNYFALTMKLNAIPYGEQVFEKYDGPPRYLQYAITAKGLGGFDKDHKEISKQIAFKKGQTYLKNATDKNGNILLDKDGKPTNLLDYSETSYISLIEAGSILEDALFHDALFDGDGRFNNHFYSAQRNGGSI